MDIKWGIFFLFFLFSCQHTNPSQSGNTEAATIVKTTMETGVQKNTVFQISGTVSNPQFEGKYLRIFETEGKDLFLLDSVQIENGLFDMSLQNLEVGIYKLGIFKHDLKAFIIQPIEKAIKANLSGTSFKNQMTISGSKENEIWKVYSLEKNKHNQRLTSIRRSKIARNEKLPKIRMEEQKLKLFEEKLAIENKGTYAAKIIKIAQSPNRFDKNQYWNDVDFNDESLIHSTVLNDRIQDYMRSHGKAGLAGNDGFLNAVDFIYSKSNSNERVMNFMLYAMMEGFYTSNMTEVSSYIIDNYVHGDACGTNEVSELIKQKANGLRSLEIGQQPPEFSIKSEKGEIISLKEVSAENEYTLVFFWSSWCHNCEQQMPILKRTYSNYQSKGFEIIGVSVDKDRSAWLKGIESKGCNWLNVCQFEEWESPVVKSYRVTSTPMMFLINKNQELVLKSKNAVQIESWLKGNLN